LDLRFKMEEAKYRRNVEELDRSRVRTFTKHREDQRSVQKELLALQKDRNRFEREKMLRIRENKREEQPPPVVDMTEISRSARETAAPAPLPSDSQVAHAAGGIASLAFEPDPVARPSRSRAYSRAKTEPMLASSAMSRYPHRRDFEPVDNNRDIKSDIFPRVRSNMETSCSPTGGNRTLWGDLWMSAKKEHEVLAEKSSSPWVDLMLKTEKQKLDRVNKRWGKFLVSFRKQISTGHRSSDEDSDTEPATNGDSSQDFSRAERTRIKWNDSVQSQDIPAREWNNRVHYQDCAPRVQETQSEGVIDSKYRPRLKNSHPNFR